MFKKRGQVSVEFVITIGFAFLMLIPIMVIFYEHNIKSNQEVNANQAGLIARKITDTSNSVYYLGHPTALTIKTYMPDGVESISITGKEVVFRLSTGQDVVSISNVNLTGNISTSPGLKNIRISALVNKVNVSEDVK